MLQVPLKVRPSAVRTLHVETPDSFSLNDSFVSLLTMTSTPRTHPMVPCLVRTMYQISLPTDSAMGKSVSPFSKVAMRSFFFQAEDGIRAPLVTGVQTCALPI